MGEAKKRGTRGERIARALTLKEAENARIERARAEYWAKRKAEGKSGLVDPRTLALDLVALEREVGNG